MKYNNLLLVSILIVTVLFQFSCSSSKTTVNESMKQQIETGKFIISVDYMIPTQGASKSLTSSYSLAIQGDTLISYLPYFGRAYNIPYGGGKGLNFTEPLYDYSLSFNSKGTANISLRSRSEGEVFLYNIEIFNNRKATILVTSNNRREISFYGTLDEGKDSADSKP